MARTVKVNKRGRIFEVDYAVILWRKRRKRAEAKLAKEEARKQAVDKTLTPKIRNIFE